MKMILFASALALSTAAFAQDTTPTPPAPDSTMPAMPDASTPPASPDASMPDSTPDSSMTPATGDSSMSNMSSAQQQAASTDDSNLPTCSATVTDKCVQKGATHHRAPHKHWKKK